MNLLYVDVVGGAAGDMLLAALLDAGASRHEVSDAVSAVLGRRVECVTTEVRRRGLRALALSAPGDPSTERRRPRELLDAVERAALQDGLRAMATAVLRRLFDAEAKVHGRGLDDLELEELGEDDTLLDVVGVAAALASLGVERVDVSAIPMPPPSNGGTHGSPAPVMLELLSGFALRPSVAGMDLPETVTPTAAAILSELGRPVPEMPELVLERVGVGAGTRDPASVANVVRVLLGSTSPPAARDRRLLVLEANVDDLGPELVPDAIDALLAAGALDAWTAPIVMKWGRPAVAISALCEREELDEVRRAFFEATTTLGVRVHEVSRPELDRRIVEIDLAEGGPRIRVKLGVLEGRTLNAKPEHADVVEAARKLGRPVRSVHAQATALAYRLLEEDR
ncbi:MAG TPA: nickel pincer cofactor biosynthesis protein LarC [Actinomycetota bacterium]